MPTVAWIMGFAIVFFTDDHGQPHFHIRGNGCFAKMMLEDLSLAEVKGEFTPRELRSIRNWARQHLPELYNCWTLARNQQPVPKIEE